MKSYTYNLCLILIKGNKIEDLADKIDVYFANNRITKEEYSELMTMLQAK